MNVLPGIEALLKIVDLLPSKEILNQSSASVQDVEVHSITADSREVTLGSLYFCILGAKYDGRVFIDEALRNGAVGIVHQGELPSRPHGLTIQVKDVRQALSYAAHKFTGEPSGRITNIAVTGTSGKTSVAWLLAHALRALGNPTFMGGTIAFKLLEERDAHSPDLQELKNTTMDPITVHSALANAVVAGAKASVFEATSQGVVQSRMRDVAWNGAIFTNLSRDHLDLHGTMEKYEAAKRQLFTDDLARSPKESKFAIFNFDDAAGRRIGYEVRATTPSVKVVSLASDPQHKADFLISDLVSDTSGIRFTITNNTVTLRLSAPLIGLHNSYNLASVAIALLELGYSSMQIEETLALSPAVPGRLEPVPSSHRTVFVDYAHKPDALEKVLHFLKPICKGRLICVFGCGGDRDKGKRPVMGEISRRLADVTVVTSDNPRTEDPLQIIDEILVGIPAKEGYQLIVEVDRRKAIQTALQLSSNRDIVVIAGKGHEPYQEINGVKHPFHDVAVAQEILTAHKLG